MISKLRQEPLVHTWSVARSIVETHYSVQHRHYYMTLTSLLGAKLIGSLAGFSDMVVLKTTATQDALSRTKEGFAKLTEIILNKTKDIIVASHIPLISLACQVFIAAILYPIEKKTESDQRWKMQQMSQLRSKFTSTIDIFDHVAILLTKFRAEALQLLPVTKSDKKSFVEVMKDDMNEKIAYLRQIFGVFANKFNTNDNGKLELNNTKNDPVLLATADAMALVKSIFKGKYPKEAFSEDHELVRTMTADTLISDSKEVEDNKARYREFVDFLKDHPSIEPQVGTKNARISALELQVEVLSRLRDLEKPSQGRGM